MARSTTGIPGNIEVVRRKVEHLVLRYASEDMSPNQISLILKSKHQVDISQGAIKNYLKIAEKDEKIQAAMALARKQASEQGLSLAEHEARIERSVRMLLGLMDEVRERYVQGKTVVPGEIRNWLQQKGLALTRSEWDEFMSLIEQQSLDRAIVNMANAGKEARGWLEMLLRLKQMLPDGDTHIHLTQINEQITDLLAILCDCCKSKVAGIPFKGSCTCSLESSGPVVDILAAPGPTPATPTDAPSSSETLGDASEAAGP